VQLLAAKLSLALGEIDNLEANNNDAATKATPAGRPVETTAQVTSGHASR
jgi:hypothetical protein